MYNRAGDNESDHIESTLENKQKKIKIQGVFKN